MPDGSPHPRAMRQFLPAMPARGDAMMPPRTAAQQIPRVHYLVRDARREVPTSRVPRCHGSDLPFRRAAALLIDV